MDYSLPGFSVHGILQGSILEGGCHFLLQGIFLTQELSVPIFTWECDYWLDFSLPILNLLFLHQVASISSLPLLFSAQLCESLCVFQAVENT